MTPRPNVEEIRKRLEADAPVPMLLFCPGCGLQHIDAPDERTPGWTNPPHRSHLCHGCGYIWRPCDRPTDGVAALTTKGPKDCPPAPGTAAELAKYIDEAAVVRAENQRLHDLVRHQRGPLHDAELITDAEYAALAEDHGAVARLEGYDALRTSLDAARARAAELKALRAVLDLCNSDETTPEAAWAADALLAAEDLERLRIYAGRLRAAVLTPETPK